MTFLLAFISLLTANMDTSMQKFLPSSVGGWNMSEPARLYSGDQIYHYMDGAGEVYLAYKFRHLLVQRYAAPGKTEILVEIFDMGSSRNAFGIYTYMQGRGPRVNIGQDGEYKSGLLCFWKNEYFVGVKIEKEETDAINAVMETGRHISGMIQGAGERPEIIDYVPEEICIEYSLRYFYRYEILNNHFFLAGENILLLNDSTECLLVRLKKDKSYLVLARYPDPERRDSAYNRFIDSYMPDAREEGIIRTENEKWTICARHKEYLMIIFDAATKPQGMNSIDTVIRRLQ